MVELFALDLLLQVVTHCLGMDLDLVVSLSKIQEVKNLIKLDSNLTDAKRDMIGPLIEEYLPMFVTRNSNLPAINLEQHAIEL